MLDLQNPPVAAPESALVPGMSAPEPQDVTPFANPTTGGFPNITDSSGPGLEPTQVPGTWIYDLDPGSGSARATFNGIVQFTSGGSATSGVTTWNGRTGAVTLTSADVTAAGGAPLASPVFTGNPQAPTAAPGDADQSLATTAFVAQAITAAAGVVTFNGRNGAVTLTTSDITSAGGAPVASPALTGTPTAPSPTVTDNSNAIATTAFVNNWGAQNAVLSFNGRKGAVTLTLSDIQTAGGAPINSPNFTGTPSGPTAAPGTATTQLASTAFVTNAVTAAASGVASFNTRTGAVTLLLSDVTSAGGAPLLSPTFTGTPAAPTATAGTSTTQIATTAFVATAISSMAPVVASYNGRTGAVVGQLSDVTSVGGAPLASPTFTGTAAAPTPTAGDNSTRLATTAFVATSFAPLASPTFTGTPSLPTGTTAVTQAPGNNTTALATTAFVAAGLALKLNLTGGTLTGGLTGTTASFSGNMTALSGTFTGGNVTTTNANSFSGGGYATPQGRALGTLSDTAGADISAGNPANFVNSVNVMNVNRTGGNGNVIQFFEAAANACGSISVANGNSTAFNTSSDARLKDDLKDFDAGPMIDALSVYDFRWKGTTHRGYGVLAQQAQSLFPDAITHDEDTDSWGADYSKFVPLLLNEVKALRARVAELEASRAV